MWTVHLLRPAWSYRLNAAFEDHAEDEYMRLVAEHPHLEDERFESVATHGYGRFASVADLLGQIGHDERMHKLASLAAADHSARHPAWSEDDDSETHEPLAA